MNVLEVFEYNQHFVAMMNIINTARLKMSEVAKCNIKALEKAHQSRIGTHHNEEAKKRISEKYLLFKKGEKEVLTRKRTINNKEVNLWH